MRFIETPIFTRVITPLLDDRQFHAFQIALAQRPEWGALIRGSSGLRKVRWPLPGQGKRGGLRDINFWDESNETFYLLYAFSKNDQEDLTARQLIVLSRIVLEEFG